MRELVVDPVYMSYNDMKVKFAGKWILVTNCVDSDYGRLIGGVPVAVADTVFEGQEDGFYDKFKDPIYAPRTDKDFNYDNVPGVMGFFDTLEMVGEKVDPYN